MRTETAIERVDVACYRVPTDRPESDGTLDWDQTTVVLVRAHGGGQAGLGYGYADPAAAALVTGLLAGAVKGQDAMDVPAAWGAMVHAIRNLGRPGICSMAIAAVDVALWDLKAKLLGLPLAKLLGCRRERVPIYGSGGFTSYSPPQLQEQLAGWADAGLIRVKMKVGRAPGEDPERVRLARRAVGPGVALYVDANGAYSRKQALLVAETFAAQGVSWFEEPVSADDLDGLRLLRDRSPAGMAIAAGEYGYALPYFRRMLEAGAVDVLQADATRCAGISGFMQVSALCDSRSLPLSAHTAPSVHVHPCCALQNLHAIEWFHDHVRIERLLFDGAISPSKGELEPDWSRPGLGLELKEKDARRYLL
ncbi:MAG: enolase C-terminal domain-like protein [Deltaproteobacteria bacterium]